MLKSVHEKPRQNKKIFVIFSSCCVQYKFDRESMQILSVARTSIQSKTCVLCKIHTWNKIQSILNRMGNKHVYKYKVEDEQIVNVTRHFYGRKFDWQTMTVAFRSIVLLCTFFMSSNELEHRQLCALKAVCKCLQFQTNTNK